MYQYYRIVSLVVNVKGGASEEIEKCTKEITDEKGEVKVVPCTKEESILKLLSKASTVGGNKATRDIKCLLINPSGDIEKIEEVIKPTEG